jgi:hypothetical protein
MATAIGATSGVSAPLSKSVISQPPKPRARPHSEATVAPPKAAPKQPNGNAAKNSGHARSVLDRHA